jgi:hypothetical protein
LVNRILDEPVQLSKIAFKHTLMEYYRREGILLELVLLFS